MARRCKKCGRIIKIGAFCGKDGCNKKPLPRCNNCNALYRAEKTGKVWDCPSMKAPGGQHVWTYPIEEVTP